MLPSLVGKTKYPQTAGLVLGLPHYRNFAERQHAPSWLGLNE